MVKKSTYAEMVKKQVPLIKGKIKGTYILM